MHGIDLHADRSAFVIGQIAKESLHFFQACRLMDILTPAKSGLPLAARGAGAARLGLPSFSGVTEGR